MEKERETVDTRELSDLETTITPGPGYLFKLIEDPGYWDRRIADELYRSMLAGNRERGFPMNKQSAHTSWEVAIDLDIFPRLTAEYNAGGWWHHRKMWQRWWKLIIDAHIRYMISRVANYPTLNDSFFR